MEPFQSSANIGNNHQKKFPLSPVRGQDTTGKYKRNVRLYSALKQ
ncbi:hypothetical protein BACCOPRO_01687 [Phocaeicola coprophilus DSM 18228 = JCM 13818]|uniref:Uncharacterized protein n=1 Tax=Phocaeicola coprophilus DSM 18228 = JCM 13818 TaxID=547042 RepID=S0F7X5_9BACT|nr:hypothetical protein BACCOPRO_01687 [Phocaeicola coprophilus DSM 18228 = JCM 13818]